MTSLNKVLTLHKNRLGLTRHEAEVLNKNCSEVRELKSPKVAPAGSAGRATRPRSS